ncbi:hypothetical protein MA16_Dca024598 [Dendrobium catenatum]|uniref:Uncharacterized protein n=1 Tax=Dendrobium catenatum TaxID=906689 RepID=A0A2I0X317_9ASPA|nr:hypothetical protein MA16_Dca024598 [Dendrobium catenatum]
MWIGRERAGGQELEFRLWFGVESEVGVGSERGIGKRKSGPAIGWGSSRASSSEKCRVGRELWERMGGVWSIFNDAFGLSIEASRRFQAEIPGRDASPAASAGFRAGFANLDGFSTDTRIPTGISA